MGNRWLSVAVGLFASACVADPRSASDDDVDAAPWDVQLPTATDASTETLDGTPSPPRTDAAGEARDAAAAPDSAVPVEPDASVPPVDPDAAPPPVDPDAAPPPVEPDAAPPPVEPDAAPVSPDAAPPSAARPGAFEACHPAENPCAVGLHCAESEGDFLCFPPRVQVGERCLDAFYSLSDGQLPPAEEWLDRRSGDVDQRIPDGLIAGTCAPGSFCIRAEGAVARCAAVGEAGDACEPGWQVPFSGNCRNFLHCEAVEGGGRCVPIGSLPEGASCTIGTRSCRADLKCLGPANGRHCAATPLADGEGCQFDWECASDHCRTSLAEPVCAPRGAVGDPCDDARDEDCRPGHFCLGGVCSAALGAGEPCGRDRGTENICVDGLVCRAEAGGPRACLTPIPTGEPCAWASGFNSGCALTDDCVGGVCSPRPWPLSGSDGACPAGLVRRERDSTCVPPLPPGAACGGVEVGACAAPARCEALPDFPSRCRVPLAVGAPCDLETTFCVRGACRAPAPGAPAVCVEGGLGEACPCAPGLHCLREGVCGPIFVGVAGDPCWNHAECGAGLRCNAITEQCEAIGVGEAGSACAGSGFCAPGLYCPLVDPAVESACRPFAQPGEACGADAVCVPGTTCRGANAQTAVCLVDLPLGAACSERFADPGCAGNGVCRTVEGLEGVCGAPLALGETCYFNPGAAECPANAECRPLDGDPLAGVCTRR